jgi:glycosyltransferase involved in cell wall biosynthesis
LRLCLVSREYPPETGWGGIGTYTYELAHGLAQAGQIVHVLSVSTDGRSHTYPSGAVTVHRVPSRRLRIGLSRVGLASLASLLGRSLSVAAALRQLAASVPFDLIESPEYGAEAFCHRWLRRGGVPLHVRLHTPTRLGAEVDHAAVTPAVRSADWVERWLVRSADLLSCPSRNLATKWASWIGTPQTIHMWPNPIDVRRFQPPPGSLPRDGARVLYVGRLQRLKGVLVLADAIPRILAAHPGARVRLVGADTMSGPDSTSMQAHLQALLPDLARARVEFVEAVHRDALPSELTRATVCVVPSYYENFPYTLVEAMACGCAVVCSRVGGMPEIVEDNRSGLLVPPGDPAALAEAVAALLADAALRARLGASAREQVCAEYASPRVIPKALAAYRGVVETRHAVTGAGGRRAGVREARPGTPRAGDAAVPEGRHGDR